MARKLSKTKGRKESGSFTAIPHRVTSTKKYASLGGWDAKLLLDMASQYNGGNNGDLHCCYSLLRNLGWRSPGTLNASKAALLKAGFITVTRQGGKHRASLYAITWQPIDECKGKLDVAATTVAAGTWKDSN